MPQHEHLEHALTHLVFLLTVFFLTANTVFLRLDKDDLPTSPDTIEMFASKDGGGNSFVQFVTSGGFC